MIKEGDLVIRIPKYYEFVGGSSKKFWEIGWVDECTFCTAWGRIGATGAKNVKRYHSKWSAKEEYNKILYSKTSKGYKTKERPAARLGIELGLNDNGYMLVVSIVGKNVTVLNDAAQTETFDVNELAVVPEGYVSS